MIAKRQTFDITDINDLTQWVNSAQTYFLGKVIYLTGDLGSGKTTFAQQWLRSLGVRGAITSPTYTIANEYSLEDGQRAIHADLYRIHDPEELIYLDVRDWTENSAIILIEWPEIGEGLLPPADAHVHLSLEGERRYLVWQEACSASVIEKD
ncbi:tRNA (adenosine(37)-N6)-threonylcarbamoyltransferase complex ATPase subunit type 1 TsaE [Suttonella sp. R2A3]|uniref:tRNA (adenosine(37)-N6)-threonylcarbamoyltransferase complex ATPase subunit type 1 TsaE n=1 Tax=Suttonella sp. R2A3 TaxID=2908648 RepID=UPI001EFF60ED|nr:tRNA (adenosine(37)-N6)-threonylcarbamoyltransferase complex ATPase subunit type 1 TsaE [Suttonella sp. R2A3]UJF24926.1 tRNA (adenosine(37)-N6)-threonylcarbamoyltransferase complex ATPase subunit type 1 TsaE [Suttonella sp. R2A3]